MGTVYKQMVKRPVPKNAEFFIKDGEQWAKWKPRNGKSLSAKVVNGHVTLEVKTYSARYKDHTGAIRVVSTGLTDKEMAQKYLHQLEMEAKDIKLGLMSLEKSRVADHQQTLLSQHLRDFLSFLTANECSKGHISARKQRLEHIFKACEWSYFRDFSRDGLNKYMSEQTEKNKSARTKNGYLAALNGFCNWAVEHERLLLNPFSRVKKFNEEVDSRRKRRALTPKDIQNLLHVARWRPLAEHGRLCVSVKAPHGSGNKGKWVYAELTFEDLENCVKRAREKPHSEPDRLLQLDREGRERVLVYRLFLSTGLRLNELRALRVCDLENGVLHLEARHAKNKKQTSLPVRSDLLQDLLEFIKDKKPEEPLLEAPAGLLRILERDLKAAGIQKTDARGRTVDVHALRHTFGTMLAVSGVAPRVAQAAMRHSRIELTMNLYVDPDLLDVKAAVEGLPKI